MSHLFKFFNKMKNNVTNVVDSYHLIRCVRKFAGASVFTIKISPNGNVIKTFTIFGFICFIFWYSLYFCSLYKIITEEQTIIRSFYDTKLQHYGDAVELLTSACLVSYAMWKVAFNLSGSTEEMQLIVDIDKELHELGEEMDYSKNIHLMFLICIAQLLISGTRILSLRISLGNSGTSIPIQKIFQLIFTDSIIFVIIAQYCSYLFIVRERYKTVNKVLISIKIKTLRVFMLRLNQPKTSGKVLLLQERLVSRQIKACGRIYGMLYKATELANEKFGLALLLNLTILLLLIILYLYYFMEATASGLFHDRQTYIKFLIYVFWQIGFAFSADHISIYFSEATVKEAKATPHVIHEIINSDLDPIVISEALNFSLQTVHQIPEFTAHGLFRLDYAMLLEGVRTITTFLVILLQFVTDNH